MARRAQPVNRTPVLIGAAVAALILTVLFGTIAAVFLRSGGIGAFDPADWSVIRFTIWQATLSAAISVGLAVPLARALARRRFAGRGLLITLLGAPFILPVIVAILGLLAIFGRNGVLNAGLALLGLPAVDIYGLQGILLAHVFFNLPLATRLLLHGWFAIPAERFRLAADLNFRGRDLFRHLEWPMLRATAPGAFVAIFVICLTSFAVALTLGGGPRATTIELAIYQAFRFDFDLSRAAGLSLVQLAVSGLAAAIGFWIALPGAAGGGFDRVVDRWDARGPGARAIDALWIGLVALFLLGPLCLILLRGLPGLPTLGVEAWAAAGRSVAIALSSTLLTLCLAFPLCRAIVAMHRGWRGAVLEAAGTITVAASPLVIGTGLFILIFPLADPVALALPVTALVNAMMGLPFAMRALLPAMREVEATYAPLAAELRLTGWARLRWLYLPRLLRPLGFAAGLVAALSMGDLGVIALFADPSQATLPLHLYRLMSSYRMGDAAAVALLLLALSLLAFWIFDRGGRTDVDA